MVDSYEEIRENEMIVAIIVRSNFSSDGYHFFTSDIYSQQLAYIHHPEGRIIQAHVHNAVKREVIFTKETVFVKRRKLKTDFYNAEQKYICSRVLTAGDVVLLASGGQDLKYWRKLK